ncbi:MAG: stage II sporulation protein D [Eubacteriales bacterium]
MKIRIKHITWVIVSVVLLAGIIPFSLGNFLSTKKDASQQVRMLLPDGKVKNIPLEEYLVGVLAAEMPASFEVEALKAQAVASRTYVLRKIEKNTSNGELFDVDSTVNTQAWDSTKDMIDKWGFIDYWKYRKKLEKVTSETKGKNLTFEGELIDAVYHSSCGRMKTESAQDVWGTKSSYLTNVESGESDKNRFIFDKIIDIGTFYTQLGFTNIPESFQQDDIIVLDTTVAGRVKTLVIRGIIFEATDFRTRLQLPSTDFEWNFKQDRIIIKVYGKGHGVGMSQYGANDLAAKGQNYKQILLHFYPGTVLSEK